MKCEFNYHDFLGVRKITQVFYDGRLVYDVYKGVDRLTHDMKNDIEESSEFTEYARLEDIHDETRRAGTQKRHTHDPDATQNQKEE